MVEVVIYPSVFAAVIDDAAQDLYIRARYPSLCFHATNKTGGGSPSPCSKVAGQAAQSLSIGRKTKKKKENMEMAFRSDMVAQW